MQRIDTEHINEFFSTVNFEFIKDCYDEINEHPWKLIFLPFLLVGTILYFVYAIFYGIFFVLACLQRLPEIVAEKVDSYFLVILSYIIFPIGWFVSVTIIIVPIVILTILQIPIFVFTFPVLIPLGGNKNQKKKKTAQLKKLPKKFSGDYEYVTTASNVFLRIDTKGNYSLKYKSYYETFKQEGKFDCFKSGKRYIISFYNNNTSLLVFNNGHFMIEGKKVFLKLLPYGMLLEKLKF
ncbi:MAG: hypothetical protein IJ033_02830 [Clostridia bacterium]|nr:hypothetical protein [Clostridia bacterium]